MRKPPRVGSTNAGRLFFEGGEPPVLPAETPCKGFCLKPDEMAENAHDGGTYRQAGGMFPTPSMT